uniref:Uncharacterized protein n=1 Tax=Podarcis muralis TaxID=64176 RepID=A0A670JJJ3_PODMU
FLPPITNRAISSLDHVAPLRMPSCQNTLFPEYSILLTLPVWLSVPLPIATFRRGLTRHLQAGAFGFLLLEQSRISVFEFL